MAVAATVFPLTPRDQLLWEQELARVRARRSTMSPAVAAAVQSVLRSLLRERADDERSAQSALALLEEFREPDPVQARRGRLLRLSLARGA